jgi:hypothetical protein
MDVSRDGRLLFDRRAQRREIVAVAAGMAREHNLTWLDWSFPTGLSEDGKQVLFDEQGAIAGSNGYPIYLRPSDGSPAALLGQGASFDLSRDGRWALTAPFPKSDELILLPTGPAAPRPLGKPGLNYQWARFFPDGHRLLATANEPGRGPRLFVQEVSGGKPRAISPEGVTAFGSPISPDGRSVAATGPDRRIAIYSVEPSEPKPIPGLEPDEVPILWTPDSRALYTWKPSEMPARVFTVDVTTGRRELWKEILPPDPAGILGIWPILITSDGKSYAYSYRRVLGDLFVADGLK